jgi:RNA polymerase sigma-70 factor (sigma-E family)
VDEGQREAFDAFARARTSALLRFGHVLTGDPHQAADLVQEALVRTAMAWPRVTSKDDPEGYVRRVMVNHHLSVWRRRRREVLVADPTERTYVPVAERDAELWTALARLPRRQRAVLVLRYYEDLTEADTAAVLGCSIGTVKSQASKALAKLRSPETLAALRGDES